jgi:hypothetical protein
MNASLLLPASTSPAVDDRVMADALATSVEFDLLVRAHALLPTHSKRAIAAELKISRQRVDKLLALPCPAQANEPDDIVQDFKPTLSRVLGVNRIKELAIRPQGVKYREYKHILDAVFGFVRVNEFNGKELSMQESDHRSIKQDVKRKAEREGQRALFVPDWMDISCPVECNQEMLIAAQAAYEAIEAAAYSFCKQFPGTQFKSALREITALAVPGMTKEPIIGRCQRNAAIAEHLGHVVLSASNGPTPLGRASQRVSQKDWPVAGPSDAELESLCI